MGRRAWNGQAAVECGGYAVSGRSFRPICRLGHESGNPAFWRYCGPTRRPCSHIPVRSRHRIHSAVKWDLNPTVKKQIEGGEPFDLVIINPNLVQDLIALAKVKALSHVAFGRIAMGVAAKAGSRELNIGSVEAFEHTLKSARSIAYASEGTSGGYFSGLLERLGIADEVKPKLVAVPGGQTAPAVGRGEAELGVVPVTSILAAAPEVMLVGRFPAELQSYVDFAIGISADATDAKLPSSFGIPNVESR